MKVTSKFLIVSYSAEHALSGISDPIEQSRFICVEVRDLYRQLLNEFGHQEEVAETLINSFMIAAIELCYFYDGVLNDDKLRDLDRHRKIFRFLNQHIFIRRAGSFDRLACAHAFDELVESLRPTHQDHDAVLKYVGRICGLDHETAYHALTSMLHLLNSVVDRSDRATPRGLVRNYIDGGLRGHSAPLPREYFTPYHVEVIEHIRAVAKDPSIVNPDLFNEADEFQARDRKLVQELLQRPEFKSIRDDREGPNGGW